MLKKYEIGEFQGRARKVVAGNAVVVKAGGGTEWFRGEIIRPCLRLGRKAALVKLVDRGEVRVVQLGSMFETKEELLEIPKLGVTVSIQGLGVGPATPQISKFILGLENFSVRVVKCGVDDGKKPIVQGELEGKSVALLASKAGALDGPEIKFTHEGKFRRLDYGPWVGRSVRMKCIRIVGKAAWLETKGNGDLEKIIRKRPVIKRFAGGVKVGDMCLARSNSGAKWRRAVVEKVIALRMKGQQEYKVFYPDDASAEIVQDIAQIPENMMKIPVMVEKARVSSLEGVIIGKEGRDKLTRLLNGADVVATVESFVNGRLTVSVEIEIGGTLFPVEKMLKR